MRRCKLISPTNLMLETPILSPVAEDEYFLVGKKEWARLAREWALVGAVCGAFITVGVAILMRFLVIYAK